MDDFPKPGETKVGTRFESGFGGKAANQAAMAAKLGAKVAMVGRVSPERLLNCSFKKQVQSSSFLRVLSYENSRNPKCIS